MKSSEIELGLTPEQAFDPVQFDLFIHEKLGPRLGSNHAFRIIKRSIDARNRNVVVKILGEIVSHEDLIKSTPYQRNYQEVSSAKRVVIVGAGPAGLFAALSLIELGVKPIIIERGKDVQSRRRDIAAINKEHIVNPESNYCFGEGGAGTYSDGKLYTRSTKRGDVHKILQILVSHGAPQEILFDAHPHIGTNKLPLLVQELRKTILKAGGEVRFNTRMTDLVLAEDEVKEVITSDGEHIPCEAVILAAGHSARDIFELLDRRKILIEAKPFAIGLRVEHPQPLIDGIQYHVSGSRGAFLPAASYSLVHQVRQGNKSRGVFSFCMCPGGFIVPSATAPGQVVVNGMSPSRRDSKFANSGIVASIEVADLNGYAQFGPLAGMRFQQHIEERACQAGGGSQVAPAQRLVDFVDDQISTTLPSCSYQPGLATADVGTLFPDFVSRGLREAFRHFGDKMKGYFTNEAVVLGVESRTSSPVRIPRNPETLEHVQIRNLYPCAEGAGYAGGIVSAAMDGERCAEMCGRRVQGSRFKVQS